MGCAASKLENEDTVRRCKERRRLMKQAVYSRHHLAAAHSDYLRFLRLTGKALSTFAAGEPLSVSDQTPAVLLRHASVAPQPSVPETPPPPPRPPFSPPSPAIRSSKLPHILSESSPPSTPFQKPAGKSPLPHFPANFPSNSTYSSTPSQASSVWNWENFYPPSPPGSEFYNNRSKDEFPHYDDDRTEREEVHSKSEAHYDDDRTEREEVHCSEWGDHYSSLSSDSKSDDEEENGVADDGDSKSEAATRSNFGSSIGHGAPSMDFSAMADKLRPQAKSEAGSSMRSNLKMVVRHRDLAEIVAAIEEYFEKAAAAGETVSELLETGRAQFDRSFRQLKKTVYHSSSVLSTLSSSWTSKPPLAIRYQLDTGSLDEPGGLKSHFSTLERLLAWEKKLYEEVKAREAVKIDHEKKLSSLQSQEYKGKEDAKLDKTKASIKRLQSLILVTSQAVSTTSAAIVQLRDNELAQQLVDLCYGHMYMWKSMNQFHEVQNHIVQQVRGLVNRSSSSESTSDLHRQATQDLESAVSAWHSSFCRLVKYHRDYVRSLHGWLKLTLLPISEENVTQKERDPFTSEASSVLFAFCDEWKQALDRLPDTVAAEAIKSFVNVVHVISVKQAEEHKMKRRMENASKELEKKASSIRSIEKKFYQSYSMVGIGVADGGSGGGGQVFDARDPLAEKKLEMAACRRRVEDEMSRHAKAVEVTRAMTLNNIQTGLPGVFQAMTGFSGLFTEALEVVCNHGGSL